MSDAERRCQARIPRGTGARNHPQGVKNGPPGTASFIGLSQTQRRPVPHRHLRQTLSRRGADGPVRGVGPELISGAADNDPTNVGTAAVVGAQTAYRLSWVALLVAPLLAVVMAIAAQVGIAARADLQSLVRRQYGRRIAGLLLVSVVIVNLVTIVADLRAGAAGLGLLTGVGVRWLVRPSCLPCRCGLRNSRACSRCSGQR